MEFEVPSRRAYLLALQNKLCDTAARTRTRQDSRLEALTRSRTLGRRSPTRFSLVAYSTQL